MAQITKIKLPPFGKLKLETGENIAFLSGDVPRLVLVSGSDACDIYEGQCLPSNANSPYLQNPHSFDVSAVVGFGMSECTLSSAAFAENLKSYEKIYSTMSTDAAITSHATLRSGYGFMAKSCRAEIIFTSAASGQRTRITVLNDANEAFIASKPVGFMDNATKFYTNLAEVNENIIALSGYFADTDIAGWIAGAGYVGRVSVYYVDQMPTPLRLVVDPKTAVFISRDPAISNAGRSTAREIGRNAEEFT